MSRKINIFLCLLMTLATALSTYCYAATSATSVTITPTSTQAPVYSPSVVLYDPHTNRLSGWNHTINFASEFIGLQHPAMHYRVDGGVPDEHAFYSCTLVKKLGDWDHQHANGIIADITNNKLLFSQIAGIEVLIKIDSASSFLPTQQQILDTYGQLLDVTQLSPLDDENVYLSFALYGPVSATMTFNASYLLKLNAKTELDQWLKVTIPSTQLTTYTEEQYEEYPISHAAASNQPITGLRIMAETASTKVVRNLLLARFNDDTPKLFKETSLSLQYLGVVYSEPAR
ncbi:hypothetical protein [Paraglaciecola sp.]|uniref:hypothetical protein n=1 Tax=Paraglaciecola sp. TaxID=1920173 RepID=UPI0030F37587